MHTSTNRKYCQTCKKSTVWKFSYALRPYLLEKGLTGMRKRRVIKCTECGRSIEK